MGEAFLHGHGGMNFKAITATLPNTKYIVGDPSYNENTLIYATFGHETVRLFPSECVFTPTTIAADTTHVTISKTVNGVTRSVSIPITVYTLQTTFGENSWDAIAVAAQWGKAKDIWQPGDEKTETIGGSQHTFRIVGFDNNNLAPDDEMYGNPAYNNGSGKAHITLQFKTVAGEEKYNDEKMKDRTKTFADSKMNMEILPALYAQFPQALKNVIRLVGLYCFESASIQNPGTEVILPSRLSLIEPYVESQSILHTLRTSGTMAEFYFENMDRISPYQLFYDGYIGIGSDDSSFEWTRGFSWYDQANGYQIPSMASSADYYNPRYSYVWPDVVKPYRPIFNI